MCYKHDIIFILYVVEIFHSGLYDLKSLVIINSLGVTVARLLQGLREKLIDWVIFCNSGGFTDKVFTCNATP